MRRALRLVVALVNIALVVRLWWTWRTFWRPLAAATAPNAYGVRTRPLGRDELRAARRREAAVRRNMDAFATGLTDPATL